MGKCLVISSSSLQPGSGRPTKPFCCGFSNGRSNADTLPSRCHGESKSEHARGLGSWRLQLHPLANRLQGPRRMEQIENIFDPFGALFHRGLPNEDHLEQRRVVLLRAEGPFNPSA